METILSCRKIGNLQCRILLVVNFIYISIFLIKKDSAMKNKILERINMIESMSKFIRFLVNWLNHMSIAEFPHITKMRPTRN